MKPAIIILSIVVGFILVLIIFAFALINHGNARVSEVMENEVELSGITMVESGELAFGYERKGAIISGMTYYWLFPGGRVMMAIPGSDMMLNMELGEELKKNADSIKSEE